MYVADGGAASVFSGGVGGGWGSSLVRWLGGGWWDSGAVRG